jgi:hypothetical protein
MSEHIGPGFDSGPFVSSEADIRAAVEELDRKRLDALYAEIHGEPEVAEEEEAAEEPKAEEPKAEKPKRFRKKS